jgi:hypothetical protein
MTMAKLIVQHDEDPGIAIILEEVLPGTPGRARGFHGTCTECGFPMHRWTRDNAVRDAQRHVDRHTAHVIGIDPSSIVR